MYRFTFSSRVESNTSRNAISHKLLPWNRTFRNISKNCSFDTNTRWPSFGKKLRKKKQRLMSSFSVFFNVIVSIIRITLHVLSGLQIVYTFLVNSRSHFSNSREWAHWLARTQLTRNGIKFWQSDPKMYRFETQFEAFLSLDIPNYIFRICLHLSVVYCEDDISTVFRLTKKNQELTLELEALKDRNNSMADDIWRSIKSINHIGWNQIKSNNFWY